MACKACQSYRAIRDVRHRSVVRGGLQLAGRELIPQWTHKKVHKDSTLVNLSMFVDSYIGTSMASIQIGHTCSMVKVKLKSRSKQRKEFLPWLGTRPAPAPGPSSIWWQSGLSANLRDRVQADLASGTYSRNPGHERHARHGRSSLSMARRSRCSSVTPDCRFCYRTIILSRAASRARAGRERQRVARDAGRGSRSGRRSGYTRQLKTPKVKTPSISRLCNMPRTPNQMRGARGR